MARVDTKLVRLTVGYNAVVARGLEGKLPEDLAGTAIPDQIAQHESAVGAKAGKSSTESGTRSEADAVYEMTENLLRRVRHGVLASFEDSEDPRIAALGALGIGENQVKSQTRLANLASTLAAPVTEGLVVLVAALQPAALRAQADRHAALNKEKGGATASRQVGAKTLEDERRQTRQMLRRLRGFVISHLGPEHLDEFGFGLPAPATRPRLAKGEPQPA